MVKRLIDLRTFDDVTEVRKWMEEIMQFIWSESQQNLVDPQPTNAMSSFAPKQAAISDTGFLLGSADPPFWEGDKIKIVYDAPYACVVGSKQKVKTNRGHLEIGNFKGGESIMSKDGEYHQVHKRIRNLSVKDKPQLMLLKCEKSRTKEGLLVTADHLVLTQVGDHVFWEEAGRFRVGDIVFKQRKIGHKRKDPWPTQICQCGREFEVKHNLKRKYCFSGCYHKFTSHARSKGKRWKLSMKSILKKMGKNNPAWKGGISKFPYGPGWTKILKQRVKERDNYTCQECGLHECDSPYSFHVHHIDGNKFNNTMKNLITLCPSCHGKQQWRDAELVDINLEVFEPVKLTKAERVNAFERFSPRKGSLTKTKLYDLSIVGENSFICGGILIHNSFIEYGTDPHPVSSAGREKIRKWVGRKLRLKGKEADRVTNAIVWKIRHHGSQPRPYLRPAIHAAIRRFGLKIQGPD